jgi:ADP-heptose:LPS heptosyltransferase
MNNGLKWQPEAGLDRKITPVSPTKMRAMGLASDAGEHVKDLVELTKRPPNIIIARSLDNMRFVQNYFKTQELKKNTDYIMGLGVYQQLHADFSKTRKKFLKPSKFKFKNLYKPYKGQSLEDKTLLVFRTGGIGDLLFIQPNLLYLKEKYPTCKIKFACGPQYQAMIEAWDCVDEVLDLPFPLKHLRESDYHALFEGVIERCKLAEKVNAFNLFSEWLGLNLPNELLIPKQEPKQDKIEFCYEKLKEWNVEPGNFILMQLRASSPIRTPNPKFWSKLIDQITDNGYNIILTDSPRQADHIDSFIKQTKNPDKVFNFCKHSKSLDYSIALTKLCKVTVATDSAMNHIAASVGVHCYGLYGPFPGFVRLTTYPKAKWIDAEKECAPCYMHGQYPCPKASGDGFSPCYDNIDVNKVVNDIEDIMEND